MTRLGNFLSYPKYLVTFGKFQKHYFLSKSYVATFGQLFEEIGLLLFKHLVTVLEALAMLGKCRDYEKLGACSTSCTRSLSGNIILK